MQHTNKGLVRLWNAMFYSFAGLIAAWKNETAFRQEAALCAVLIPAAFWLGSNITQKALLIGSCLLVLIVELLNSAVETVVDRVSLDKNELSARAKDLASAAVFVSLVTTAAVWGLIAYERFFQT